MERFFIMKLPASSKCDFGGPLSEVTTNCHSQMKTLHIRIGFVHVINIPINIFVMTTNRSVLAYTFLYVQVFTLFQIVSMLKELVSIVALMDPLDLLVEGYSHLSEKY